jgi:hypothetical protein
MAAASVALQLMLADVAGAEAVAQLPTDERKAAVRPGLGDAEPSGEPDAAEPEEPGTRRVEVTGIQCEALALGKVIKELPPDAHVEVMTFIEPPPVTFHLPEQRRESLTECSLRASGLTVRVDKARNVITLLPSGTGSPELPNPKVKVMLKFSEEPQKEQP